MGIYRSLALSNHPLARGARGAYRRVMRFSVPSPRWVFRPLLGIILGARSAYYFVMRVFICEPLFKACCARYGKDVHTGPHLHWIEGGGAIEVGDDVRLDGKCGIFFAARYSERPALIIGDHTGIGHNCAFVVGREIRIGRHCRIASSVQMFDSPGHPMEPEARRAGLPANAADVRPISIGDNVWIGSSSIIFPGVTIGDNSVVAMGAVVMNSVPPNVVVAGNPARQIASVNKESPRMQQSAPA